MTFLNIAPELLSLIVSNVALSLKLIGITNKDEIKLFTDYTDGSYAEYRGYNCYLDPRGEIFLKSYNNME